MKKGKVLTAVVGIALVLVLALALPLMTACPAPAPPPPPPPPEVKTLTIGTSLPLTVSFGVEAKKMWEAIIPAFNEAGGLVVKGQRYNVEVIIYDDKYTAEGGRANAERLVYEDKVKHIIGMIGSAPTLAATAVTEPAKVLLTSGCATEQILSPELRYAWRAGGANTEASQWSFLRKNYPDAKTCVIISIDDETGEALSAMDTKNAKPFGFEVIDILLFPRGTTDFSPIATKVKTLNPDLVSSPGLGGGTMVGLLMKSLHEAGWKGVHFSNGTFNIGEIKSVATDEQIEGAMSVFQVPDLPDPPPLAVLVKKLYTEKYGEWVPLGTGWMCCWYSFVAAVQKADSLDPDDLVAAQEGLEYDTPIGLAAAVMRPDLGSYRYCDRVIDIWFGQIKNGEFVPIYNVSLDEAVKACETVLGGKWR